MPTNLHRYYGAGYLHFITTRVKGTTVHPRDISQTPSDRPHRHRTTISATLPLNCARLLRRTSQPPFFDNAKLQTSVAKKSVKIPPKSMIHSLKSCILRVV